MSEDDLLVMSVEPGLGAGETCGQLPSPDKELCVLCGQEEDPGRRRQCYQVNILTRSYTLQEHCLQDPCSIAPPETRAMCQSLALQYLQAVQNMQQ